MITDGIINEIKKYRDHLSSIPQSARFMLNIEQTSYEDEVVRALRLAIPRLYALEFDDQTDVPIEVYALIERLAHDLGLYVMEGELDD